MRNFEFLNLLPFEFELIFNLLNFMNFEFFFEFEFLFFNFELYDFWILESPKVLNFFFNFDLNFWKPLFVQYFLNFVFWIFFLKPLFKLWKLFLIFLQFVWVFENLFFKKILNIWIPFWNYVILKKNWILFIKEKFIMQVNIKGMR